MKNVLRRKCLCLLLAGLLTASSVVTTGASQALDDSAGDMAASSSEASDLPLDAVLEPGQIHYIPDTEILVDGQMDAGVYDGSCFFEANVQREDFPEANASAKTWLAHDGEYLYFYAEVLDGDIVDPNEVDPDQSGRYATPWDFDGIEFLVEDTYGYNVYQTIVDASGFITWVQNDDYSDLAANQNGIHERYKSVAIGELEGGYTVEMAMKLSAFGIITGKPLRFQMQVNDAMRTDGDTLVFGHDTINGKGSWEAEYYLSAPLEATGNESSTNNTVIPYIQPSFLQEADGYGRLVVDGVRDAGLYDGAYFTTVSLPITEDMAYATADVWMVHDGEYLYVYADVQDDNVWTDPNADQEGIQYASIWECDTLELLMGSTFSGDINQAMVDATGFPVWHVKRADGNEDWATGREEAARRFGGAAARQHDNGYSVEFSVKMEPFGIEPDNNVQFQLQLDNAHPGTDLGTSRSSINGGDAWNSERYVSAYLAPDEPAPFNPYYGKLVQVSGINVLDGFMDDQMEGAAVIAVNGHMAYSETASTATAWVAQDDTNLYVYAEILDDTNITPNYDLPVEDRWKNDSFEVLFHDWQQQITTLVRVDRLGDPTVAVRTADGQIEYFGGFEGCDPFFPLHSVHETPNGYVVEMALDKAAVHMPEDQLVANIHFVLNDSITESSGGTKSVYGLDRWNGDYFGHVELTGLTAAELVENSENPNLGIIPQLDIDSGTLLSMIGGSKEQEFDGALSVPVLGAYGDTPHTGEGSETSRGTFYLSHNGEYLHVFAEVHDNTDLAPETNDYSVKDGIELTFDGDTTDGIAGAGVRLYLNRDGGTHMESIGFDEHWHNNECAPYVPLQQAITETDFGYTVEAVINLRRLQIPLDGNLSFQGQITDYRGPAEELPEAVDTNGDGFITYYTTINGKAIYDVYVLNIPRAALAVSSDNARINYETLPYIDPGMDNIRILVDGSRDSLYDNAAMLTVAEPVQEEGRGGAVTAEAWMAHDGENIYLYADVLDPNYDPRNEESYSGVLEVALTSPYNGYTNWMALYTDGHVDWYDSDGNGTSGPEYAPLRFAGYKVITHDGGYTIELALKMIEISVEADNFLGVQIYVEEIDKANNTYKGATLNGASQGDVNSFIRFYAEPAVYHYDRIGAIPKVSGIVVDGQKDDRYEGALIAPVYDYDKSSALTYLVHDDQNLYVYAEIMDDELVIPTAHIQENEPWYADSFEIFIDSLNSGIYQARLDIDGYPSFGTNGDTTHFGHEQCAAYFTDYRIQEIEGGYAVEMALKMEALDIDLGRSNEIGLNFLVNDARYSGDWTWTSYKWTGAFDSARYSIATLEDGLYAPTSTVGIIPRHDDYYPDIDGRMDPLYEYEALITEINTPYNESPEEYSNGRAYSIVSGNKLFVYAEIHDIDPVEPDDDSRANAPWETDSFEVIINGTSRDGDRAVQVRVDKGRLMYDGEYWNEQERGYPTVAVLGRPEAWSGDEGGTKRYIENYQTLINANGDWCVEMVLDLWAFDVDPNCGGNVGIQFQINDKRSDGTTHYTTINGEPGGIAWNNPRFAITSARDTWDGREFIGELPFNWRTQDILIDGVREDVYYESALFASVDSQIDGGDPTATSNVSVTHDGHFLYVHAAIYDDDLAEPAAGAAPWEIDSFEIMARSNRVDSDIVTQARVNFQGEPTAYYLLDYEGGEGEFSVNDLFRDGTGYAAQLLEDDSGNVRGYVVEMALDMNVMEIIPAADLQLQFQINDVHSDGTQTVISTNGDGALSFDGYHWVYVNEVPWEIRNEYRVPDIHYTPLRILVDGYMDTEVYGERFTWQEGESDEDVAMVTTVDQILMGDSDNATADVYALHDADSLYIYAEVKDPDVLYYPDDPADVAPWDRDSFEVILSYVNRNDVAYQGRVDTSGNTSCNVFGAPLSEEASQKMIKAASARPIEGGYAVEMALDLTWFDVWPGGEFVIQYQINDARGNGDPSLLRRTSLNGMNAQDIDEYPVVHLRGFRHELWMNTYEGYLNDPTSVVLIDNEETNHETNGRAIETVPSLHSLGTRYVSSGDMLYFKNVDFGGGKNLMIIEASKPEYIHTPVTIDVLLNDTNADPAATFTIDAVSPHVMNCTSTAMVDIPAGSTVYFRFNAPVYFSGVQYTEIPSPHYGDVNDDGVITALDRMDLYRYLNGWENITILDRNADVNADGAISMKDRAILARYIAGWKEYKLLPHGSEVAEPFSLLD